MKGLLQFGSKPPAAADSEGTETKDEALTPEDIMALKALAKMAPAINKMLNTRSAAYKEESAPSSEGGDMPQPEDTGGMAQKKTLDAADIERIAQEGAEVRTEAVGVLGSDYVTKGKTTRQVRVDVIRSFDSKFDDKGPSDEAVAVAYWVAIKTGQVPASSGLSPRRSEEPIRQSPPLHFPGSDPLRDPELPPGEPAALVARVQADCLCRDAIAGDDAQRLDPVAVSRRARTSPPSDAQAATTACAGPELRHRVCRVPLWVMQSNVWGRDLSISPRKFRRRRSTV